MFRDYLRLGEILVNKGLINEDRLQQALASQRSSGTRLGEVLAAMGWLSEENLAKALAQQFDYGYVDVEILEPEPDALKCVSGRWALAKLILPIKLVEGQLEVAIADPIDVESTDELRLKTGAPLIISVARTSVLRQSIIKAYTLEIDSKPRRLLAKKVKVDNQVDKEALLNALDRLQRGVA
jgi:hypothetical protein